MDEFPFSEQEWERVRNATNAVMVATLADDTVLRQSLICELDGILEALRIRYGDHPVLLETAADFRDLPTNQVELYRAALKLAEQNQLPTRSIRISLARVLLEDFDEASAAAAELMACEREMRTDADASELAEWSKLLGQCDGR